MAKNYMLTFGGGLPSDYTGLAATFVQFSAFSGVTVTPPGITETPSGSGLYWFTYGPTIPIGFVIDGGSALGAIRYVTDVLDPIQAVNETVGQPSDSFGSTSTDPTTLFGHAKRQQETNEGVQTFTKSTGIWNVYSRGGSILLDANTLTNTTTQATRT